MIGIPYAYAEVDTKGNLVRTCPVCGEKCRDRPEDFDTTGEHATDAPDTYHRHYYATHNSEEH